MTFRDQSAMSAHNVATHAQMLSSSNSNNSSKSGPKPSKFECHVCARTFTVKASLKTHLSAIHEIGDVRTFKCDSCSHVSKYKCHLKSHMAVVHGLGDVKIYQCDVCRKAFHSNFKMKVHMEKMHKNVSPD